MAKQKFKHSSLTHFIRRNGNHRMVAQILARCDVTPRVGCLPPELVPLVRPENRAYVADEFGKCLEQFWARNKDNISMLHSDTIFDASDISALFNTECHITARGVGVCGVGAWSGGFGVVCKVSFPKINAEYALKYFLAPKYTYGHGAAFEIPAAFAANHAEPRDNCPVYMASFKAKHEFMLSKWAGDKVDEFVRQNKYAIYLTSDEESWGRNWRGGRRIDYGETFRTDYGAASYPVRKMFRKIVRAAERGYDCEIEYMYHMARNNQDKNNFKQAISMAQVMAIMNDKDRELKIIEDCIKLHYR